MSKLRLDFIQGAGMRQDVGYLLLAVISLLLIAAVLHVSRLKMETSAVYMEINRSQASAHAQQNIKLSEDDKRRVSHMLEASRRISQELNLPWVKLFASLEHARTDDIGVLEILPTAKAGSVRITAEARAYPAMLEYVKRLSQEPVLDEVYLLRHRVDEQSPEKPLQFVVEAAWKLQ